jgi:hypothetical protein
MTLMNRTIPLHIARDSCPGTEPATAQSAPIRIETMEGPLEPGKLRYICDLYGRNVDARYSDLEFSHRVFNCNPAGRSYHAFAFAGKEAIGCHAVIPIKVSARGREVWAGKGEALYVSPGFRPAGLFLVNRSYASVANRGFELLFGLTRDRVGRMLTALGFTAVPCVLEQQLRLNRPDDIEQLAHNKLLRLSARALNAAQAIASTVVESLIPYQREQVEINHPSHLRAVFATIASAGANENGRWSVSVDEESLQWCNSIGRLDVLSVGEDASEFVAVTRGTRGGNAVVMRWNVRAGGVRRALRILQYIIEKSKLEEAAGLSLGPSVDMTGNGTLQIAAVLLGFIPWNAHPTIYVKSTDPFFLDPQNVNFTRSFSI